MRPTKNEQVRLHTGKERERWIKDQNYVKLDHELVVQQEDKRLRLQEKKKLLQDQQTGSKTAVAIFKPRENQPTHTLKQRFSSIRNGFFKTGVLFFFFIMPTYGLFIGPYIHKQESLTARDPEEILGKAIEQRYLHQTGQSYYQIHSEYFFTKSAN